jgi:hypothetical protein
MTVVRTSATPLAVTMDGRRGTPWAAPRGPTSSTALRLHRHRARGMPPTAVAAIEISRIDAVGEVRRLRDMGMEKLCGLWAWKWGAVACAWAARASRPVSRTTHSA